MACFPNHAGLGFITRRLSAGLDPLSISMLIVMRTKTAGRRRKIPRLLLGDSPGQSTRASPLSSTSASSSPTPVSPAARSATPSSVAASSQEETVVVKKGKEETSVSTEEITAPALEEPESNALPRGVVEISDDELEDLTASVTATASISPSEAGPSAPWVTAVPHTSGD